MSSTVSRDDATEPSSHGPRVRAGAIAWGLIVVAISVSVLVTVSGPASRREFAEWLGRATPGSIAIIALLSLGALILLLAALAVIRRAQRR
jgi:hypothetical protein